MLPNKLVIFVCSVFFSCFVYVNTDLNLQGSHIHEIRKYQQDINFDRFTAEGIYPPQRAGCRCENGKCVKEGGEEVCKCPHGFGNYTNYKCKECECGTGIDCLFKVSGSVGSIVCFCNPGYSTKYRKCVACECGPDSNCTFDGSKKSCICKPGYGDKQGKCEDCECGPDSNCTFTGSTRSTFKKSCHCKPGYKDENGICVDVEASSSRGTTESFTTSTTHSSTGQDCHCGSFSYSCSLDSAGNKVCNCFMGYSQLDGSCAECNCGPNGTCTFENGRKKCACKSNATQMNGNCVDKQDLRTFFLNLLDKFS